MQITKCDKCKKNIKDDKIVAGYGFWPRVELCNDCGKPIDDFFKENKLLKHAPPKLKTKIPR